LKSIEEEEEDSRMREGEGDRWRKSLTFQEFGVSIDLRGEFIGLGGVEQEAVLQIIVQEERSGFVRLALFFLHGLAIDREGIILLRTSSTRIFVHLGAVAIDPGSLEIIFLVGIGADVLHDHEVQRDVVHDNSMGPEVSREQRIPTEFALVLQIALVLRQHLQQLLEFLGRSGLDDVLEIRREVQESSALSLGEARHGGGAEGLEVVVHGHIRQRADLRESFRREVCEEKRGARGDDSFLQLLQALQKSEAERGVGVERVVGRSSLFWVVVVARVSFSLVILMSSGRSVEDPRIVPFSYEQRQSRAVTMRIRETDGKE
jgi:hypothetical protein